MSAAKDYEVYRRSRQTHIKTVVQPKKRIAFLSCGGCGYFWAKEVIDSSIVSSNCPKCNSIAEED